MQLDARPHGVLTNVGYTGRNQTSHQPNLRARGGWLTYMRARSMRLWHPADFRRVLMGFITSKRVFEVARSRWCDGGAGNIDVDGR
jgi:hypothetical protein